MVYKEIVDKIIELLKADVNLQEPSKIAKYFFGIPVEVTQYPAIYVQFDRRSPSGIAEITRFLYNLTFEIGIIDRSVSEDDAEKSVYDKAEAVESVLDVNPTLDGLVIKEPQPYEVDVIRARESDYSIAWARVFATWRKWMP